MDLGALLLQILTIAAAVAFVTGLVLTALTGSARPIKIFMVIVAGLVAIALAAGFFFSRGMLVYLLFQIISLVLVLFLVLALGAVCGGGIYVLRHRKPVGKSLSAAELEQYLSAAEFATREGITEERALSRIKSGLYSGGRHEGKWYIHKSELQQR